MSKPVDDFKPNPAANDRRMWFSLAVLAGLALLAWFTIDADAVMNVKGFSSRYYSTGDFQVHVRWIPVLLLALFGFRVWIANVRAKLEKKPD